MKTMSGRASAPELSAILVAPDGPEEIRKTLRHVHAQDIRHLVEVVIVAEDPNRFVPLQDEFPGFAALRIVEYRPIERMGPAKSAGIAVARGGLVVLLEDHAYPAAGWARALMNAWREGMWSGVAPAIENANPQSGTSWANLFVAYGRWVAPSQSGERRELPGHNSAFDRQLLVDQGEELGSTLDDEWAFCQRLRAEGHRLYLVADARVAHLNISNFWSAIKLRYYHGRLSAASRAGSWPTAKRAAHVLAVPLIPLLRWREVWRQVRVSGIDGSTKVRLMPSLAALVTVGAIGETVGYAAGPGDSPVRKATLEHDRNLHLNRRDREQSERDRGEMMGQAV